MSIIQITTHPVIIYGGKNVICRINKGNMDNGNTARDIDIYSLLLFVVNTFGDMFDGS